MKKVAIVFISIILFSFQAEPTLTVRLTVSEWQQVLKIIDNAEVNYKISRPLYEKILTQADVQLKALDSAGKKPKN